MDFLFDLGVSAILTTLKNLIHNPTRKAAVRKVMLKIYTQIGIVFANDEDFIDSAISAHDVITK
jgi:hypothetical protein